MRGRGRVRRLSNSDFRGLSLQRLGEFRGMQVRGTVADLSSRLCVYS